MNVFCLCASWCWFFEQMPTVCCYETFYILTEINTQYAPYSHFHIIMAKVNWVRKKKLKTLHWYVITRNDRLRYVKVSSAYLYSIEKHSHIDIHIIHIIHYTLFRSVIYLSNWTQLNRNKCCHLISACASSRIHRLIVNEMWMFSL